MAVGFAGSRCIDERRRRRLAQECEAGPPAQSRPAPRAPSAHAPRPKQKSDRYRADSPVESLIRPQLWVNLLLGLLGLAIAAAVTWLGAWVDAAHPQLAESLGLETGLLAPTFVGLNFLFATQLAYVILWYRTRSRKDFRGQYKVWRWIAPTWLLFGLANAIDGTQLVRQLIAVDWNPLWRGEVLCWLAPAAVFQLTTTRFLLCDMQEDRWGRVFVVLAGLSALSAAVLLIAGPLMPVPPDRVLFAKQFAVNLWALCTFLSMLFHARFVVHVTNEAPRPGRSGGLAGLLLSALSVLSRVAPRRRKRATSPEAAASSTHADGPRNGKTNSQAAATPETGGSRPGERPPAVESGGSNPSPVKTDPQTDPAAEKNAVEGTPRALRRSADAADDDAQSPDPRTSRNRPEQQRRASSVGDADLDEESLRGLSKKQRRRLRKQRRQKQRSL